MESFAFNAPMLIIVLIAAQGKRCMGVNAMNIAQMGLLKPLTAIHARIVTRLAKHVQEIPRIIASLVILKVPQILIFIQIRKYVVLNVLTSTMKTPQRQRSVFCVTPVVKLVPIRQNVA